VTARRLTVRPPAVAGAFYPARAADLAAMVDRLLAAARVEATTVSPGAGGGTAPLALVVPHAGYLYSGPTAAAAYALLTGHQPDRVVLLGPAHYVPLSGLAVPTADAFATPLGRVSVDQATCRRLTATLPRVRAADEAHEPEHSLEVQLPFLQRVLGVGWGLVPLAVGSAEPAEVADVVDAALGDASALLVISTDLSHGLDQPAAVERDRHTVDAVLTARAEAIGDADACGAPALCGAVEWTRRHGLTSRLLDRRTSADATGNPTQVVGYAALAIGPGSRTR
jgi:MEMO1 family protein